MKYSDMAMLESLCWLISYALDGECKALTLSTNTTLNILTYFFNLDKTIWKTSKNMFIIQAIYQKNLYLHVYQVLFQD